MPAAKKRSVRKAAKGSKKRGKAKAKGKRKGKAKAKGKRKTKGATKPTRRRRKSGGSAPPPLREPQPAEEERTLSVLRAQYVNAFNKPRLAMHSVAKLEQGALGWLGRARARIAEKEAERKAEAAEAKADCVCGMHGKHDKVKRKVKPGQRALRPAKEAEARELLLQRAENLGLRHLPCDDDGNCQFRAVSRSLYGNQRYHAALRRAAVTHMREHRGDFEAFLLEEDGTWEEYLENTSIETMWGDNKTLIAMARALRITIHILSDDEVGSWVYSSYEPDPFPLREPARHAFLAFEAPVHYDAIVAEDEDA